MAFANETIVFTPVLLTPELLKRINNMEKKKYIKPEIEVMELAVEASMLTGSLLFNEEGGKEESLSNRYQPNRRGKWGDLWYVEEQ